MFRSFRSSSDGRQCSTVASGMLYCIAVSCISNHELWLPWLLMQLTAIAVKQTACDSTPLSAAWWWSKHIVALTSEEEKKNCCVRRTHNCFVNYIDWLLLPSHLVFEALWLLYITYAAAIYMSAYAGECVIWLHMRLNGHSFPKYR
jgi:hypothetical protein